MSDPRLDDVLRQVAAGELSPEDAVRLLDTPSGEQGSAQGGSGDEPAAEGLLREPPSTPGGADDNREHDDREREPAVRSIRLAVAYRAVTVIADSAVSQAHVSGPHTVRRDGDVLVIESDSPPWPYGEDGRFSFSGLPRSIGWGRGWQEHAVTVRVNPQLPLDVDAAGCNLRILGLEAGAHLHLIASAVKADRLRGPLSIDAMTSSFKGSLGPTGQSRLNFEQSSAKISLLPGTSVRIQGSNRMSKVILPGHITRAGGPLAEAIEGDVGDGRDRLTVDALMSSVILTADSRTSASTVVG